MGDHALVLTGAIDGPDGPSRGESTLILILCSQFQSFARASHRSADRYGAIDCSIGGIAAVHEVGGNIVAFAMVAPGRREQTDQTNVANSANTLNLGICHNGWASDGA